MFYMIGYMNEKQERSFGISYESRTKIYTIIMDKSGARRFQVNHAPADRLQQRECTNRLAVQQLECINRLTALFDSVKDEIQAYLTDSQNIDAWWKIKSAITAQNIQ